MSKLATAFCPTCSLPWSRWQRTSTVRWEIPSMKTSGSYENFVECEKGHRFPFDAIREGGRFVVTPPQPLSRATYKPSKTDVPCQGCGHPILPGELYVGGAQSPRHLSH